MPNSFRIRTQPGVDKSVNVYLDQDFEFLEILSLKILQSQIYNRPCSDYGVVVGRVSVNNGFGIPNAKVSIFIPLDSTDAENPIISDIYPYKTVSDLNEDGYRYNLLPYVQQHGGHVPTGTFFDRSDVLIEGSLVEVFDKYYKYTARTNESGDFMIFGVPLGPQTIHMDVDLSDIGQFSLSPQDLIRMGRTNESQVAGVNFKKSTNLAELPQIVSFNRVINIEPLWGQENVCNIGITRCDFDLTEGVNIKIEPTAIFMGSIFSDTERMALKSGCKPRFGQGELCNLIAGPGEILAIRQTVDTDINGRPVLEEFPLDGGGQVIDENGTWLVDVPMNLDYLITNEFGEQVISDDPSKGIPTKAKYRFKIKWNQSPSLSEDTKRAYFLVPNIREFGWSSPTNDPLNYNIYSPLSPTFLAANKSYAFSLDWNDYADVQGAIDCIDTFYYMTYNKVYSVSQLMDQHRLGTLPNRFISVKNILDDSCESDNNKFPANETVFRGDIIFLLFLFAFIVFRPVFYALIFIIHVLYVVIEAIKNFGLVISALFFFASIFYFVKAGLSSPAWALVAPFLVLGVKYFLIAGAVLLIYFLVKNLKLAGINLPVLLYDSCEFCNCKDADEINDVEFNSQAAASVASAGGVTFPNDSGLNLSEFFNNQYFVSQVANNQLLSGIAQLMAGKQIESSPGTPNCGSLVPDIVKASNSSGDNYWYTTNSLNLAERINLFNTKAKYFDNNSGNNPGSNPSSSGGGTNRIKVSFNPTSGVFHEDNVVFMMLNPDSLTNIAAGDIISFQDPLMSKDINVTGATENDFGNNAITGETIPLSPTNEYTKTIFYSNPNDTVGGNLSVTYTLSATTGTTNFHKFPIDIEYFQVITAMTYSDFSSSPLQGNTLPNSLNLRYLANNMAFLRINDQNVGGVSKNTQVPILYNPLGAFEDSADQVCVIMVRGVDPYSTRQTVSYDLSKIFGHSSYGNVVVTGDYKLNQPIIGGFLNVKHDNLTGSINFNSDSYSSSNLYYESFQYQLSSIQFSSFTSNLPSYYSILDKTISTITTCSSCSFNANFSTNATFGKAILNPITITPQLPPNPGYLLGPNSFTYEYAPPPTVGIFGPNTLTQYTPTINTDPTYLNSGINSRGYLPWEIVEGGSMMIKRLVIRTTPNGDPTSQVSYISSAYNPATTNISYPTTLVSNRIIVMRSDRLPASTKNANNCGLSYLLQNNPSLGIYKIPDNGVIGLTPQQPFASNSLGPADSTNFSAQTLGNDVIDSLNNCKDSVPLKCYKYNPVQKEYYVDSGPGCQSTEYANSSVDIWDKGCYKLITKIILSIPTDLMLLTEWLARVNITFAACRNVFSHVFTNNWINGTLYAISFKNNRIFNSQNIATSEYCHRVVTLDPLTNNFYYRSSPYFSGNTGEYFCGDLSPQPSRGPQQGNLKYPTTLVDLGPRSSFLQELSMSDNYDGYVVQKTTTTTFTDVSDLLNIFILSRLANTKFIDLIFSTQGANIFSYFNKRWRGAADADYVQMVAISSQLGVAEFSSENYPPIPGSQDPIYFNGGDAADGVFGIFFSSNTQVRDFISPKRTIIVPNGSPTASCTYSYFNVFTQKVPFYQWDVVPNDGGTAFDSIFGSQGNNWYTTPTLPPTGSPVEYFSNPYQQMDRIDFNDRYFQTNAGSVNQSYYKGYIYGITSGGTLTADLSSQSTLSPLYRRITVGAPFYFYFGLKRGGSAWDRFARKWIGFEPELD